jgi:aspartyl protease family protein
MLSPINQRGSNTAMGGPIKLAIGAALIACCAGTLLAQTLGTKSSGPSTMLRSPGGPTAGDSATLRSQPAAQSRYNSVTLDPDRNGHYRADVEVFGRRIRMLVDTGATIVALTNEDADALGVRPMPSDFTLSLGTANGAVQAAAVRLAEIRIGSITALDVPAVVMPQGAMRESLLGMSFLRKLGGFEVAAGKLILKP